MGLSLDLDLQQSSYSVRFNLQSCVPLWMCCLVILVSGCVAFDGYPKRATNPETDLALLGPQIGAEAIMACLNSPTFACRNKIIAARMHATDIRFSEFEESLFRETRKSGFAATLGTLGLTSAAAVASGGASQALSGIAAFIIGGREAFQKEVLAERTVIAIHTAMRAKRAEAAIRLREGLRQTIDRYPMELGLGDINDYYNAGTVLGALVNITETVGAAAKKAESDLQNTLSFRPDSFAKKFEQVICGGLPDCPTPDTSKFNDIRACWVTVGVPSNTLMTDFILQESFARQRVLVAACMGL